MTELSRIEIHSADHCVQKCNFCSHAADVAPKRLYDAQDYERHLKNLRMHGILFRYLEVIGGEPFINPKLEELVDLCLEYSTEGVCVMSNMFWLKSEEDLDKYKSILDKISILVPTIYKPLVEASGGKANLMDNIGALGRRHPNCKLRWFTEFGKIVDQFCEIEFHKDPRSVVNNDCSYRGCKQLLHTGQVLGCCSARRVINWDQVDRFDVSANFSKNAFIKWYERPILDLCSHCSIATKGVVPVTWSLKNESNTTN